jgi:hypothetical protein
VPETALCRSRFGAGVVVESTKRVVCGATIFSQRGEQLINPTTWRIGCVGYCAAWCPSVRDRSLSFAVRCWRAEETSLRRDNPDLTLAKTGRYTRECTGW